MDRKYDIIDRLNIIVNKRNGINITLEQVINNSGHFLNYKLGNDVMDACRKLVDIIKESKETIIYNDRYYFKINTNELINELDLTELEMYKHLFKLQDLGFIKVVIKGTDVYTMFDSGCIFQFIEIGQQRLLDKVNRFDN